MNKTTFIVTLLACVTTASAWGPTGHRVVGRIAEYHLTPKAAKRVAAILGPVSLAEAGTWADEIRSDAAWKHAAPWHYISIDDHETLETTARDPRGDAVEAMQRFEKTLRNSSTSQTDKEVALKFLVHLVGDIHQPLHVGRRGDAGGNKIQVTWFSAPTNLHAVWDDRIIESDKLSFSELAAFLERRATPDKIAAWQKSGYVDWVRESFAARSRVYDTGNGHVGYAYADRNRPFIRERILQASIRLAGLLNDIFR